MITVEIPWPPTVNAIWRQVSIGRLAGRTLLSAKARSFYAACSAAANPDLSRKAVVARSVRIDLYPPNRRKWDIDNRIKAVLDGLQKAGVIEDDSTINELQVFRREVVRDGKAVVTIQES